MAKKSPTRKKKSRGPGRPVTRGETVSVTLRMSKDISERIEKIRARNKETLTRTEAVERLLRDALANLEA